MNKPPKLWEVMAAGAIGAFAAAIGNHLAGQDVSIAAKLAVAFNLSGVEIAVILGIAVFGALLCWVHSPASKIDGFARGLAVLALFSLAPATEGIDSSQQPPEDTSSSSVVDTLQRGPLTASLHWMAFSSDKGGCPVSTGIFRPNARVVSNEWLSETEPTTRFFSPKIYIEQCGNTLKAGQEVELLNSIETSFSGYYYVLVRYIDPADNQLRQGWIWSGRRPNYWQGVSPTQKGIDANNVRGAGS
jgi:hypothetical protein